MRTFDLREVITGASVLLVVTTTVGFSEVAANVDVVVISAGFVKGACTVLGLAVVSRDSGLTVTGADAYLTIFTSFLVGKCMI